MSMKVGEFQSIKKILLACDKLASSFVDSWIGISKVCFL